MRLLPILLLYFFISTSVHAQPAGTCKDAEGFNWPLTHAKCAKYREALEQLQQLQQKKQIEEAPQKKQIEKVHQKKRVEETHQKLAEESQKKNQQRQQYQATEKKQETSNPGSIWLLILVIIGVIGLGCFMSPGSCYVCDIAIKQKSYNWIIDGENRKVCPNCNRKLENKKSSAAMKAKFG